MEKFIKKYRFKLSLMNDVEIIKCLDELKKRFGDHFKIKRLDWLITTLNDRDKLRAYINIHAHQ